MCHLAASESSVGETTRIKQRLTTDKLFSTHRKSGLDHETFLRLLQPGCRVDNYCDEYVCMSVCLSIRITRTPRGRTSSIFVHVVCGHGLVLLWRRCDALCTSGFMDDVVFLHRGTNGRTGTAVLVGVAAVGRGPLQPTGSLVRRSGLLWQVSPCVSCCSTHGAEVCYLRLPYCI